MGTSPLRGFGTSGKLVGKNRGQTCPPINCQRDRYSSLQYPFLTFYYWVQAIKHKVNATSEGNPGHYYSGLPFITNTRFYIRQYQWLFGQWVGWQPRLFCNQLAKCCVWKNWDRLFASPGIDGIYIFYYPRIGIILQNNAFEQVP